jgi:putative peptidoglycan lipid II flippase
VHPVPSDPSFRPDAEPPAQPNAAPGTQPGAQPDTQPGSQPPDPDAPVLVAARTLASPGVRRLAGAAALIAVLTIASRLLGFVRTLVLGKVAIAELSTAYLTANLIPNIIFEIVAGGALASLVVPLVAGAIARRDRAKVGATASALMTWVVIILVPLTVLVAVFAQPIVSVLLGAVGGDQTATVAVGTRMLRIFAPQIPLYGIGIVLSGLLQGHRRFAWPVLAPLLSSVVVIATYVVYGLAEPSVATIAEVSTRGQLILAIGTTLGVVVLSLSLVLPVRGLRLRWRPTVHFDSEARRSVSGLAAVGVVTVVAQQLTLALATRLANSDTPHGFIYVFTLAQTVYLVPWSVFALPVATSVFPALATAYATGDEPTFRRTSAGATRSVALLSALGAAGMIAIAGPIARLFAATASQTRPDPSTLAAAIIAFAPGLVGYGLYALHSRTLFARGQNRYAAVATLAGWITVAVASVLLSVAFPPADRITALGAANSAGMAVLATVLIVMIARRAGRDALRGVTRAMVTAVFAAGAAAAAGIAVRLPLSPNPGVVGDVLQGILSGVVAVAVFAMIAAVVDRRDLRPVVSRAVRAIRGGRDRGGSAGGDAAAGDQAGGDATGGRIGEPTG